MNLPTLTEIEALHRKCAPSEEAFHSVYTHCQVVAEIADQLMTVRHFDVDPDVVRVGCLLHDLGVYRLYKDGVLDWQNYICHGVLGDDLLREEGFPERICRFASHHTGVGLRKADIIARKLPIPHQDFLAENEEESLVMYADKFHSKSEPPRFNDPESYAHYVTQFGPENEVKFREMMEHFGLPDLGVLSTKWGHAIV